jgi:cation-transporting ATPase E
VDDVLGRAVPRLCRLAAGNRLWTGGSGGRYRAGRDRPLGDDGGGLVDVREQGAADGTVVPPGLTQREADALRRRGEGNTAVRGSSRGYARILHTNVFSFSNTILFVIGAALLALGRYHDPFTSVGLGLVDAAISAVQEIRAKRKLDRLQLLDRGRVTVVRAGRDVEVVPEEVVRGDVLHLRPGDQVVVDGPVLDGGSVEVDGSLLTGESGALLKEPGDDLLSGSSCVGGEGHQLARDVGAAGHASRLTCFSHPERTTR